MTAPTTFTELEAVNFLLASINEAPVNTLEGSTTSDVIQAQNFLNNVLRMFQAKGWHFNEEKDYPLVPNEDGEIVLASNVVRCDLPSQLQYDVVQIGRRLYNKLEQSYTFTETIEADLVVYRTFDELPEPARHYVIVRATRQFQEKVFGSETLSTFDRDDEKEAKTAFLQFDLETGDYNIFNNQSSQNILDRKFGRVS